MTYRRKLEDSNQTVVESSSTDDPPPSRDFAGGALSSLGFSGRDDSVAEEMRYYTRVQILAQLLLLSDERQGTADTSDDFSDDEADVEALRQVLNSRGIAKDTAEEDQRKIDTKLQAMGYSISPPIPTRLRSGRSEDHGQRSFHSKLNESDFAQTSAASAILSSRVGLKPTGIGKWAVSKASVKIIKDFLGISKASAKINKDTSFVEPLDISTIDLEPTGVGKTERSKGKAKINKETLSTELLDMPTTDLEPTGADKSEMSKASVKINEDTSSAEPSNMPTKSPVPQPSGGAAQPRGGGPTWWCHCCHYANSVALSDRCCGCSHTRCGFCRLC